MLDEGMFQSCQPINRDIKQPFNYYQDRDSEYLPSRKLDDFGSKLSKKIPVIWYTNYTDTARDRGEETPSAKGKFRRESDDMNMVERKPSAEKVAYISCLTNSVGTSKNQPVQSNRHNQR